MFPFLLRNYDSPLARRLMVAFWLALAVSYYVQDVLSFWIRGYEPHWKQAFLYTNGWLFWVFATPLVIYLAERFPIKTTDLTRSIWQHLALAFAVSTAIYVLESVVTWILYRHFILPTSVLQRWFGDTLYKTTLNLVVYFLMIIVVQVINTFKENQKIEQQATELREQLTAARLQALKMQLNPHFLFNTHNAIISFLHRQQNETGIAMLLKLSDMLRQTLDLKADKIPLSKELEIIGLYLDIQKMRFGERLQIHILAEGVTVQNALVPSFFLQPIVENAIEHGIAPRSDSGILTIKAMKIGEKLQISIADDGVGCPNPNGAKGIGLSNTMERLKQLYGTTATLSIQKNQPRGTVVVMEIPL